MGLDTVAIMTLDQDHVKNWDFRVCDCWDLDIETVFLDCQDLGFETVENVLTAKKLLRLISWLRPCQNFSLYAQLSRLGLWNCRVLDSQLRPCQKLRL